MSERLAAVFVSDVHLKGVDDARTRPFADFLRSWVGKTETLVLLGDIFDFYYGFKSVVYWQHLPALAAIDELVRDGIRVIFVEGNHEFRIAEAFRGAFGIETFESEGTIDVRGKKILLCHGDLANPKDRGYRLLHWAMRNPLIAAMCGMVPPSVAQRMGKLASDGSRAYANGRGERLTALFREKARASIAAGCDAAIFGHSHHPVLETIESGGRTGTFANCGDWVEHFTHLTFDGTTFVQGRSERPAGAGTPLPGTSGPVGRSLHAGKAGS